MWLYMRIAAASIVLTAPVARSSAAHDTGPCRPQALRVLLYPFVPSADALFLQLEAAFEKKHPCVDVQRVETYMKEGKPKSVAADYYKGGAVAAEADVYELDTVLLGDVVDRFAAVTLPAGRYLPIAENAVTVKGKAYAVPHWVCGNFLFHRAGDAAVEGARTWGELKDALAGAALMADFKGTSTLGEWYATALLGLQEPQLVDTALRDPRLDSRATEALTTMLSLCPSGFCRSDSLHDLTGVYPRLFARGQARAYVGYSESLFYALREIGEDCGATLEGCIRSEDIRVRALPPFGAEGRTLGWVDAFAIPSALTVEKRRLAEAFVELATSDEAYRAALTPEWPDPPRYLLPALRNPKERLGEVVGGGLYPALFASFGTRATLNAAGTNQAMRDRGGDLDCALPIDRDDVYTIAECKKRRGKGGGR